MEVPVEGERALAIEFYSYSLDGGNAWAPNVQVSNSFDPFLGYPNQNKMGDYMTIVSGNAGGNVAYCATFNGEEDIYYVRVAPMAPVALSAVSRKTHGAAGTFDVLLPLSGNAGIECRSGSGSNADGHQVVVAFANPVTDSGVVVTSVDGLATATQGVAGGVVTIDLSAVKDGQTIAITLKNANDSVHLGDVTVPMGLLLGDTTRNGTVNASDVSQVKLQSGQIVSGSNFRTDVIVNGSINASDVSTVKSKSGTSLP